MILGGIIALAIANLALVRVVFLLQRDKRSDHAKCIAHIASVTSNRVVAMSLRELADHWDGVEGNSDKRRIANTLWIENGPTVPAIWLREQADRIEGFDSNSAPIYNLSGEREA